MALFAWSERQAYRLAVKVIPLYPKYFVYEGFFKRRNPLKECYLHISGDESYNLRREFLDGEREKKQDCGGLQKEEDFIAGENCSTAERAYRDTEENNNRSGSHSYEIS